LPGSHPPGRRRGCTGWIDCNGRVAEASVTRALGKRLDIREDDGLAVVEANRRGVFGMTGQGCLRLPAAVRHWCGLVPGDRVLLVAESARGRLVVYPPAVLDEMVAQFHGAV
jgi:hypothetical protein